VNLRQKKLKNILMKKQLITTALILFSVYSYAQNNFPDTARASKSPDNTFVMKAANGGMMEVELGNYAQSNAADQRVKNFGSMMVRDHSKANMELKSIATQKSIRTPETMDEKHQSHTLDMKKKKGADFDKDYMNMMVNDHNKDIDEFKKAEKEVHDKDLRDFITRTIPVLQTHLDSAKAVQAYLKGKK
jgi:putative membrane protein